MSFVFDSIEATTLTNNGITTRRGCSLATTGPIVLADLALNSVIDGVTVTGSLTRILVKNQTNAVENGIYEVGSPTGPPPRAQDYEAGQSGGGVMIFVFNGSTQADTGWVCTADISADTIGTNPLPFQQFCGNGVDGNVLTTATQTLTNKTLVQPNITTIFNTGVLDLPLGNDTIVGRSSIETLTSKVLGANCEYQGLPIAVNYGGTGTATFTAGVLVANGSTAFSTIARPTSALVGVDDAQVLTSKRLNNANCTIGSATQLARFSFTGGAQDVTLSFGSSGTAIFTFPAAGDTVVCRTSTDTLTNKTLTLPVISSISNGGTITLPMGTRTLVARDTTDTLTNKTLTSPIISTIVNTGTITLPTATDTLVGRATTDTLTNKTIAGTTNTVEASALQTTGAAVVVDSAPAPLAGQVLTATSATAATWQTPTGGAIFGSNFAFVGPIAFSTTSTSAIPVTGSTLSATLPAGTFVIEWSYKWQYSATNTNFIGRFRVDAVEIAAQQHTDEPSDSNAGQRRVGFARHITTLTAGAHSADMLIQGGASFAIQVAGLFVMWYRVA
jgi:hypothetical protein